MKITFASFLQPENFGAGRLIGLVRGKKPRNIDIKLQWEPGIPSEDLLNTYQEERMVNPEIAVDKFVAGYRAQLDDIFKDMTEENRSSLPFQDGDTLISWERAERSNYRKILAEYLEKLGYEVVVK